MNKRIFLLVVILILNSIFPFGMAGTDSDEPRIVIIYPEEIQVMRAGEKNVLSIEVRNESSHTTLDMTMKIAGEHPFRSDVNNFIKQVYTLNSYKNTKVDFNVEISPTAKAKLYEFDVEFAYKNVYGNAFSEVRKMYIKVENDNKEPILGVYSAETSYDKVTPGVEDAIKLKFINTGTMSAKDVNVKISGFGLENLMLNKDVDTKKLTEIKAGETQFLYYNIICAPKAKTGVYPYKLNLEYIDEYGGTYKKEFEIYISVEGNDTSGAKLTIQNIKVPDVIVPKQPFEVTLELVNEGNVLLEKAEAGIEYPTDFTSQGTSKKVVKNLKPGAKSIVTFLLMAKSDAKSDSYSGYINVKFLADGDSEENAQTIQEYVGLVVDGSSGSTKPKLIIENYEYGGEHVLAGESYDLKLFIKNTSTSSDTKNIKVTLTSEENVFTPMDSSNSFFITKIGAGEIYEHNIQLKTKIDAAVKIYPLAIKMVYEDGKGNAYDAQEKPFEESESLSIAVAQPVRLETAELIIPFENYVGQPFYIEQEFYNMGKSIMYNTMVKLEGPESSSSSYFVGNFEAGRSEYYSAEAIANEEGTFEGKLIYTFEDALGNVSIHEVPFSYTVVAAPVFDEYGNMNGGMGEEFPMEEPPSSSPVSKIIIGVVALLLLVGVFIFRKKRKKRKLAMELEALDE
ncbi:COG1361 S-layer family protein [Fusibacter sp. 3D3]|uniref:COG1361 S-layer family protein n=1 Tax=Fusibacter sp. 3D3 TaxID=1048380 RepID=UPI000853D81C|nr:hypothetical protein [Fusibacter sp. 3D3]GAU77180.1 hypothetical protein F3D3_1794 [Fusibacter sp. 3D3]